MLKAKTVKSVFDKFTADLEKVSDQQQAAANTAFSKREELKAKMEVQKTKVIIAEGQVAQAARAIKNIGELLGVEQ